MHVESAERYQLRIAQAGVMERAGLPASLVHALWRMLGAIYTEAAHVLGTHLDADD